jgi:hypothetical protein
MPRDFEAEFVLEESGCGCGYLTDVGSSRSRVWHMKSEASERLANALQRYVGSIAGEVAVSATWAGDRANREVRVTLEEVVDLVRRSELGITTRYLVSPRVAS